MERMEREILMTTQVEAFLDDLHDSDLVSHRLVRRRSTPEHGFPRSA